MRTLPSLDREVVTRNDKTRHPFVTQREPVCHVAGGRRGCCVVGLVGVVMSVWFVCVCVV